MVFYLVFLLPHPPVPSPPSFPPLLQNFNEAPDAASKDAFKQIRTLAASVNPDDQHPPDLVAIKRWLI